MFWPFSKSNSFFPANAIAVDLGTANTLIYVKGDPSPRCVIFFSNGAFGGIIKKFAAQA